MLSFVAAKLSELCVGRPDATVNKLELEKMFVAALITSSNDALMLTDVGTVPEKTLAETTPRLSVVRSTGAVFPTVSRLTPVAELLRERRSLLFGSALPLESTTLNTTWAWVVPTESFK